MYSAIERFGKQTGCKRVFMLVLSCKISKIKDFLDVIFSNLVYICTRQLKGNAHPRSWQTNWLDYFK